MYNRAVHLELPDNSVKTSFTLSRHSPWSVLWFVESSSHYLRSFCEKWILIRCLFPGDLFDMLLPMLSIYQEYVRNHHYCLQVSWRFGKEGDGSVVLYYKGIDWTIDRNFFAMMLLSCVKMFLLSWEKFRQSLRKGQFGGPNLTGSHYTAKIQTDRNTFTPLCRVVEPIIGLKRYIRRTAKRMALYYVILCTMQALRVLHNIQGLAKRWALGCMNSPPPARGS